MICDICHKFICQQNGYAIKDDKIYHLDCINKKVIMDLLEEYKNEIEKSNKEKSK